MREPIQIKPTAVVPPLRARTEKEKKRYVRRPAIEQTLQQLLDVDIDEIARRGEILDQQDTEYLPPEVLVHYLRCSKNDDDTEAYRRIFSSIRQHLLQRLKVQKRKLSGNRVIEDRFQADVRDRVMNRAMEILCADRRGYDNRLDYYEINFNGAVSRARITAKRDLAEQRKTENSPVLEAKMGSDEAAEIENVISSLRGVSEKFSDVIYRSEVFSAINSLPPKEKEVMLMLVEGYKIKEIAERVDCTPQTASARRNRARAKLKAALDAEIKS